MTSDPTTDPAARLAALPQVAEEVVAARQACERLRWHPAMRRRSAQVRAEAGVWQAWASARLDGAKLPVDVVRAAVVGAAELPTDPVGLVVAGVVRAVAEADHLAEAGGRRLTGAPRQALARLHLAAASGLVLADDLGRPRPAAAQRLDAVVRLLADSPAPAVVVAAIAVAELVTSAPFETSNGVVGRALARSLSIGRELDPMGAAVPDLAFVENNGAYLSALQGYEAGGRDGVVQWLAFYARAVATGAERGHRLADSVLAGRTLSPDSTSE